MLIDGVQVVGGSNPIAPTLRVVFFGVAQVAAMPLLALILMDMPEVGSKNMGAAAGMYFYIAEIDGFGGPFVVGAIRDLT
ncbi:hypothetical protein ACFLWO_02465 [Chloroflexota bacterium]